MKLNLSKISNKIQKNKEPFLLIILFLITVITTQTYNFNKEKINNNYINLINNIYFNKSLDYIFDNLKPKYIDIRHVISEGETFNKILKKYRIPENEVKKIKKNFSSTKLLNNLKTKQIIYITVDQSQNRKVVKFIYPISINKKIKLVRNLVLDKFEKEEIITNLNTRIIYKEGKITQSLYKSAVNLDIKPNVIVDFARIYGFQVDFQRDIRKNDTFQIMYEIFEDDNGKVFDTGNIIFADLKLTGQKNSFYYFQKKDQKGTTMLVVKVLKNL